MLRSMTNESAIHATANYWMHTGWGQMGRPSVGAWVNYGLGSEADNLPGFVVLNAGLLPTGGVGNYKSGFLPASRLHVLRPHRPRRAEPEAVERGFARRNNWPPSPNWTAVSRSRLGKPDAVESGIKNYELAAKLQTGRA